MQRKHGSAIALVGRVHEAADRWLVGELKAAGMEGVVPSHGDILSLLFSRGEATMHELAAHARRTKPTTTILVDKLEAMGLVRRERSGEDARATLVRLTPKGEALRPAFASISRRLLARAYAGLSSAEADALDAALERLLANFAPEPTTKKNKEKSE